MAETTKTTESSVDHSEEEEEKLRLEELLQSLPKEKGWITQYMYLYQQFWCRSPLIQPTITFQKHNDIVIATLSKSGTTWLKALCFFAIVKRSRFIPTSQNDPHPLLNSNPHSLVPFLELDIYANKTNNNASKDTPNKVLFLKYEELKENTNSELKRMAQFLDYPFTPEEESGGVIDSIIELCSFKKMKELEVNKSGKIANKIVNKFFFRKGKTGGWVNYFSPSMIEKLSKVIEEKLGEFGLFF
ncbi:cytosolic sulfotransferase 15-like [Senna tora]|uniref:Sulfotransferase n=1 Tax=Senna tora TaxID=362788 RepID=A0A834X238_9FABA|nr:cytosolic sulfotransferase 15-like [Senna tora]